MHAVDIRENNRVLLSAKSSKYGRSISTKQSTFYLWMSVKLVAQYYNYLNPDGIFVLIFTSLALTSINFKSYALSVTIVPWCRMVVPGRLFLYWRMTHIIRTTNYESVFEMYIIVETINYTYLIDTYMFVFGILWMRISMLVCTINLYI